MKFARYHAHGETAYGVVEDGRVYQITTSPFEAYEVTDHTHTLEEVRLLAPVVPQKILAIGLNYESHLGKFTRPERPEPFWKPPSAIVGPEDAIIIPTGAERVDAEGELVVVMGRRAKKVTKEQALDYVLGFTCGNDVSARHWQKGDLQWWRAKGSDTFAPLGPFIATDLDPARLEVKTRVNGEEKQSSSTALMIFDVPTIISHISQVVTLEPGDVIFTGTPGVPPHLYPGDVVEVEVPGVGILRNTVRAE